mgnify:CR=1 FL=1
MEGQTINIQAIINPISGVGSKRKIPKMIETAFAGGKLLCGKFLLQNIPDMPAN